MNTKDRAWTFQEEQELIDLRYEDVPLIEVAKTLGRTVDSCRKKHWKLMQEAFSPAWYERIKQFESGEIV